MQSFNSGAATRFRQKAARCHETLKQHGTNGMNSLWHEKSLIRLYWPVEAVVITSSFTWVSRQNTVTLVSFLIVILADRLTVHIHVCLSHTTYTSVCHIRTALTSTSSRHTYYTTGTDTPSRSDLPTNLLSQLYKILTDFHGSFIIVIVIYMAQIGIGCSICAISTSTCIAAYVVRNVFSRLWNTESNV